MYRPHSEFNLHAMISRRQEHNADLLVSLKNNVPEPMFLDPEVVKLSHTYNSSFTMRELQFPFYDASTFSDLTAASLLSFSRYRPSSYNLSVLSKTNRKLNSKINAIFSFLEDTSLFPSRSLQATSAGNRIVISNSLKEACRRITDAELRVSLASAKNDLLEKLSGWSWELGKHREVVEELEGYKKLVMKYLRRQFRREEAGTELWNVLGAVREEYLSEVMAEERKKPRQSEEKGKTVVRKSRKRNKSKNVWAQLNLYFLGLGSNVDAAFDKYVSVPEKGPLDVQFLNMFAVNRLAAIIKMRQYCFDNGITLEDFVNGRTYQKIKAHLKQIEELVPESEKETRICPSLEEIPYLQSIGADSLPALALFLKDTLMTSVGHECLPRYEELKQVEANNRRIIQKVREKMNSEEAPNIPLKIPQALVGVKKRYRRSKKCNSRVKKRKVEDLSDTNTNSKEDPSKTVSTTAPKTEKAKFKIHKAIPPLALSEGIEAA
eukprot:TRINITY_DN1634_c0_g1_i1.p1 TRINITY_DN1634_c0_g1~~TRINITY_DN1634_c0_g1_i1.p1  ORF type:complete len:492 (-),score=92.54 TRINITY_DN1634_c0_g1_i1:348-1823(-)